MTTPTPATGSAFARQCYNASVTGGVSPAWARRMLSDAAAVIDSLHAELAEARAEPAAPDTRAVVEALEAVTRIVHAYHVAAGDPCQQESCRIARQALATSGDPT